MLNQSPLPFALVINHAIQHVAVSLDRANPSALSFDQLRQGYQHPMSSDLVRVRKHNHLETDDEAHDWIIRRAVSLLGKWLLVTDNGVEFRYGVGFDDLRWDKKPIDRPAPNIHALLHDPFNKMSGKFADNVRHDLGDLTELRDSMKAWGWIERPQFRALGDNRGKIILIGHRRITVAKELGIDWEKHVDWIDIGDGDAADAERFKLSVASNIGQRSLTPTDRKRLAEHLYGEHDWSMERIASALNVAVNTISLDLKGFPTTGKPKSSKGGRPKGSTKPKGPTDETQRALAALRELRQELDREPTYKEIGERAGTSSTPVRVALAIDSATPAVPQEAPAPIPAPEPTPQPEPAPAASPVEPEIRYCQMCGQLATALTTAIRGANAPLSFCIIYYNNI